MKIKDIVHEGFKDFAKSFVKAAAPRPLQQVLSVEKPSVEPSKTDILNKAGEMFGSNPLDWLTPEEQEQFLKRKEEELKLNSKKVKKQKKSSNKTTQDPNMQAVAQNVASMIRQPAATTAQSTQPAPTQVRLPSGQYVTKYGDHWFDEQGQRIVIPGDIDRLEQMARGPSGQSQMAATKNVPVDLPGYKGKRR